MPLRRIHAFAETLDDTEAICPWPLPSFAAHDSGRMCGARHEGRPAEINCSWVDRVVNGTQISSCLEPIGEVEMSVFWSDHRPSYP